MHGPRGPAAVVLLPMRRFSWLTVIVLVAACKPSAGDPCEFRKQDCGKDLVCVKPPQGAIEAATCMTTAQANELCKKEKLCQLSGACSYTIKGGGVCAPQSDEDCQQADPCTKFGRCTAKDHMCIVASDEDCQQSEFCTKYGKCKSLTDKRPGRCVKEP